MIDRRIKLGEVCDFLYGENLPEPQRKMGSVPVYGSNGVVGWHHQSVTKGPTIIVGRKGSIGEVHFSKSPCWPIDTTYYVEATKKPCDLGWLYYMLVALDLTRLNKSAAVPGLNRDDAYEKELPFILPSEQKRIATLLGKIDHLRLQRRYALKLSNTYLQSVFLEMFYENACQDWHNLDVESVANTSKGAIRTGPFGSQLLHSEFVNAGVAVLGIDNAVQNRFTWGERRFITEEKYQQLKRYTVFSGDVIITIMGTPGRCAVVPDNIPVAINTKHLCCVTLDQSRCLPTYLQFCFLTHPSVLRQLNVSERGAVMPGLNMEIIKDLVIPCPPLPLQEKFAKIVLQFERLQAQQREALRQAEHLFQTLLHQAFQGELISESISIQGTPAERAHYHMEVSPKMPDAIETSAYQLALPLE